ncbi:MAG TPA: hypothetical protein PK250_07615 [Syntrophobacter fumaroxidans]|nr:hypothetical protein [Syntrophobacter fumaroxidans]
MPEATNVMQNNHSTNQPVVEKIYLKDTFARTMLSLILVCLIGLVGMEITEKVQRGKAAEEFRSIILDLEKERKKVFLDYVKDLKSEETKSIYHQMYHASNAQLKMTDLLVQQNQIMSALIAGKK